MWASIILLLIQEVPQIAELIGKWVNSATQPTVEDITAELAQLGVDDATLLAAYARLFPGQTPPQA